MIHSLLNETLMTKGMFHDEWNKTCFKLPLSKSIKHMHSGLNEDEQQERVWEGPQMKPHCKIIYTNNFSIIMVHTFLQDYKKTGVSTQLIHKAERDRQWRTTPAFNI